jgi:hypothetical protein
MPASNIFTMYQNWTDAERTQLEELRHAFPEPQFELECQCSDHDEPWCLVHDKTFDRNVLHLARIGLRYVIAIENQPAVIFSKLSDAIALGISKAPRGSTREVA